MQERARAKKVELTELFYDLVFVYAISRSTEIIHHLHGGTLDPMALFSFAVVFIVLVNSWMVETVFTNRFGSNSLRDVGFMFCSMVLVLVMSANLTGDLTETFRPFSLVVGIWTLLLLAQYALQYRSTTDGAARAYIRLFFWVLGARASCMFAAVAFDYPTGLALMLLGVVSAWVMPGAMTGGMRGVPINFPHLTERLSLLVIITLGETIVGIAPYFVLGSLSMASVFVFLTVAALFVIYVMEFDRMVDRERAGITGNGMIYLHYPVLFGISAITVSLSFLADSQADRLFTVAFLYTGIALFLTGVFLATRYNKPGQSLGAHTLWASVALFAAGLVVCLIRSDEQEVVSCVSSLMLVAQAACMVWSRSRPAGDVEATRGI